MQMKNNMLKKGIAVAAASFILLGNVSSALAEEVSYSSEESYEITETQEENPSVTDEVIDTDEIVNTEDAVNTDEINTTEETISSDESINAEETESAEETELSDDTEDLDEDDDSENSETEVLSANYIFENKTEDSTYVFISVGEDGSVLEKAEVVYTLNGVEHSAQGEVKGNVAVVELSGDYELISMKGIIDGVEFISYLSQLDDQEEIAVDQEVNDSDENISDLGGVVSGVEVFDDDKIAEAMAASADMVEGEPSLFNAEVRSKPVIVIDPGHGLNSYGEYSGANRVYDGVLVCEDVIVMKIARYLKEILEANGVEVYLTREENTMPSPSLEQRVAFAKEKNASALVSIHLNSSTSSEPHGLMAMTAKIGSYNPDNAAAGQNLANTILDELMKLGFGQNYGLYIRDIDDGTTYPDGSLADYYGICRYGQLYNVPSTIIEHGFLSNESDYRNYLSSDEKLKKLAQSDADGILKYLGINSDTGWRVIDGKTYYYQNGVPVTGTPVIDGKKYWFDGSGVQQTGWLKYAGMTLYFNPNDGGAAAVGTVIADDGKKYWFDGNGVQQTGWLDWAGMKLYFDPNNNGAAAVGTVVIDGNKYWFDNNGVKRTGWLEWNGMKLYFDPNNNGAASTGIVTIDNRKHRFDSNGVLQTGWYELNGSKVYFDPNNNGAAAVGTVVIDGKKYWFDDDGTQQTGWLEWNGMKLYFNPDDNGAAVVGLGNIDGKVRVFDGNGVLYTGSGTPVINGKKYYVQYGEVKSGWLRLADWQMYFDPETYEAYTGIRHIDGKAYMFDKNGVEIIKSRTEVIDGKKYWFQPDGSLMSGWCKLLNWTMYFDPETYAAATGFTTIDSKLYHFDNNGVLTGKGTPIIEGKKYVIDEDGVIQTGWIQLTDEWMLYGDKNDNGAVLTGWNTIESQKYYFDNNGIASLGFCVIDNKHYYIDIENGMHYSDTPIIDGKKYCFDDDGVQQFGWYMLGSWKMYFDPDNNGAAVTDYIEIDGIAYKFNADGICVEEHVATVTKVDPASGRTYQLEGQFITDPQIGTDVTEDEFFAAAVYTEAGNQGLAGQTAVAMVMLNRLHSEGYPNTLSYVIYQKTHFAVARDGSLTRALEAFRDKDQSYIKYIEKAQTMEAVENAKKIMNEYLENDTPRVIEGISPDAEGE